MKLVNTLPNNREVIIPEGIRVIIIGPESVASELEKKIRNEIPTTECIISTRFEKEYKSLDCNQRPIFIFIWVGVEYPLKDVERVDVETSKAYGENFCCSEFLMARMKRLTHEFYVIREDEIASYQIRIEKERGPT